jgi:hypothetical protein
MCRYILHPKSDRCSAITATQKRVTEHRTALRHRFEDVAVHIQHLPARCFRGEPDLVGSEVPDLRKRMDALQDIPAISYEELLSRAHAEVSFQKTCNDGWGSPPEHEHR